MEQYKIDRINELARKAKTSEGLTDEETRERAELRKEYIEAFRASTKAAIESIRFQNADGTLSKPVQKK